MYYPIFRLLSALIVMGFFTSGVMFAFDFLNVGFDIYGSYLVWLNAVVAFWLFLPQEIGEVFTDE